MSGIGVDPKNISWPTWKDTIEKASKQKLKKINAHFLRTLNALGDSNEAKIRVAEYSTILFQQGQPRFVLNLKQLSNVFKSNRMGIEPESNGNPMQIKRELNINRT